MKACVAFAASAFCAAALASDIVYLGGGAWEGGVAPGADDVAVFTNDAACALAPGAAWGGIRVDGGGVALSGENATLALGAGGITVLSGSLTNAVPLSLAADLPVEIALGAELVLSAPVQKNGHATSVHNLGVFRLEAGAGTFDWGAGDGLAFGGTGNGKNRGMLDLRGARAVSTADWLEANWTSLSEGEWIHRAGVISNVYALALGSGLAGAGSRLVVDGGTVDAYRLSLGQGNKPAYPAEVIVSNGLVNLRNTDAVFGGVEMCLAKDYWGNSSDAPEGHLTVAGGKLSTSHIRFGSGIDSKSVVDFGYAQVWLRGGELELKGRGIFASDGKAWRSDATYSSYNSWHDVTLSGGTLSSPANNEIAVRVRLDDADGGAVASVPDGRNLAFRAGLYGGGSLRKEGAGNLRLAAVSSFTGRLDVAEGTVTLGYVPTAVFRADDLAAGPGETVTAWPRSSGASEWEFNAATAAVVNQASTSPTVAAETINGHKAVRFDGVANALALSASAAVPTPPCAEKKKFTVFAVVRATSASQHGAGETSWKDMPWVVGAGYVTGVATGWGLCVNSNGCAGAGVNYGSTSTNYAAWGSAPVTDGRAHVLGFTWSAGEPVSLFDGFAASAQDAPSCTNAVAKTRVLLGMSESKAFFAGDVAEIVFYNDIPFGAEQYNQVGWELARKYGAAFEPAPYDYEPPAPDAVWTADSLPQGAGEAVTEWGCSNTGAPSGWKFNSAVATVIDGSSTSPTISPNSFNGHKAVSFNGTTDLLAITKNVSGGHVFSNVSNLTVAVVFRAPEACGSGLASKGWSSCAGMIAANLASAQSWGISMASNGRMGLGVRNTGKVGDAAWTQQRHLNDGLPHVAIFSYGNPSSGHARALRSLVDGHRAMFNTAAGFALANQRVVLGMNEEKHHFAGEIAELRIYRDVALDLDQMLPLGWELARKYGCDHHVFDGDVGSALASERVEISQGATVDATTLGYTVPAGQTWIGAGAVAGILNVASNGVVSAAGGNLSVSSLVLEAGAAVEVSSGAGGVIQVGDLALPSGEIALRVAGAGPVSGGVFLRWTGVLRDDGAVWTVPGRDGEARVRMDAASNTLRLVSTTGTVLMLR